MCLLFVVLAQERGEQEDAAVALHHVYKHEDAGPYSPSEEVGNHNLHLLLPLREVLCRRYTPVEDDDGRYGERYGGTHHEHPPSHVVDEEVAEDRNPACTRGVHHVHRKHAGRVDRPRGDPLREEDSSGVNLKADADADEAPREKERVIVGDKRAEDVTPDRGVQGDEENPSPSDTAEYNDLSLYSQSYYNNFEKHVKIGNFKKIVAYGTTVHVESGPTGLLTYQREPQLQQ